MFSLYLECRQQERERLIAELWESGSTGITESDLPGEGCRLRAFFDGNCDAAALARAFAPWGARPEPVETHDWIAEARSKLEPMCVGARFFLAPEWRDDPTPAGRVRIVVNPGMAFGTGAHESTQLCLEAIEQMLRPAMTVLDVGAGSGILSAAAQLLGAGRVIACDIDRVAVELARQPLSFVGTADAIRGRCIDLVLANISPEAIVMLAPQLIRVLRAGGAAIVSGFELGEADAVQTALEQCGALAKSTLTKGNWCAIVASV